MVSELSKILDAFPGAANQMRCFAHTVSILAKAILKQFDIPKKKEGEVLDKAAQALSDMAQELKLEERVEEETQERKDSEEDDRMLDAWVDFHEGLTEEEVMALDVSVQPVRSMLVKVRLVVLTLTIL
jgi:CHASE3 domain sensor protein